MDIIATITTWVTADSFPGTAAVVILSCLVALAAAARLRDR